MRYGVAILPAGQHRDALALAIEAILREDFEGRILAFDSDAAREYAAIARSRGMAVATHNVRDFDNIEIEVFDPWTAP